MAAILLIEDDPLVRRGLQLALGRTGHEVRTACTGEDGLRELRTSPPDLVVLDLMLPGIDGLEVCRRLRAQWPIPVVMLTALGEETDRVVGFETGADDYVTKPFSPRELVLRLKAVLRRGQPAADPPDVLRA
ncbi:MAG: response regulator transcription factor, partial [Trebonia sp.]